MSLRSSYQYNFDTNYENEDDEKTDGELGAYKNLYNIYSTPSIKTKTKTRAKLTSSQYCDDDTETSSSTSPYFDELSTDWNDEFQRLLDQFAQTQNLNLNEETQFNHQSYKEKLQEKFETSSKLRDFCARFGSEATEAAKMIIAEHEYPLEEKTVRPTDLGGIAGGSKYVWKNMVLKFAIESDSAIYGGNNELIMKVANQELKGLEMLIECKIQGLHFPLMALVDYRGYRVIVSSLLPIDKSTIVYGSPDGGITVHDKSPEAKEKIARAAAILNLKKHLFEYLDFYGPVDMEVHSGKDGRLYVVDTSRLFPPTIPIANNLLKKSGQLLAYHLRPMVVKKYPVPLSSDGLSQFGRLGSEAHDVEIIEATKTLINDIIPKFAREICQNSSLRNYNKQSILALCRKFHVNGINLRYLGVVRRVSNTRIMKDILLIMAIARAAKSLLQRQWRDSGNEIALTGSLRIERDANPERKFKKAIASVLSNLISRTEQEVATWRSSSGSRITNLTSSVEEYMAKGTIFWTKTIQEAISLKYVDTLTPEELNMDLRKQFVQLTTWREALIAYFNTLVGLPEQNWSAQLFVKEDAIKAIESRTKLLNVAYKDLGMSQVSLAHMQLGSGESLELILQAEHILDTAYKIKSDDTRINKSIAANIIMLGKLGFVDQDKMLYAETLCDDCLYDAEAKLFKAKLIYQRSFVRNNARVHAKRLEAASLVEGAISQLQEKISKRQSKGSLDFSILLLEYDARITFATIALESASSEKVYQILSVVKSQFLPLPQQDEYVRSLAQTLLLLPTNYQQNYQQAVQLLREHCVQNPQQYTTMELWKTVLDTTDLKETNLIPFVKQEQTLFEEFLAARRKVLWPESSAITVGISTSGSGDDIRQRKMDVSIKALQGEVIPFLKMATFRLHSTFYPNVICLNQAPLHIQPTASFGVSTARIELEFCSCFLPNKEDSKGWLVSIEWPITPEKQGTFNTTFEINFASRTVKPT